MLEPTIETLDWDQETDSREQSGKSVVVDRRLMATAVTLSLALHVALGSSLLGVSFSPSPLLVPDSISIRLIPELPPVIAEETDSLLPDSSSTAEIEEIEIAEQIEEVDNTPLESVVEADQSEPIDNSEPAIEEELPAELIAETEQLSDLLEIDSDPIETNPPVPLPSLDVIQSVIQREFTEQQQEDRDWASTCTNLQRQSGVIACASQEETDLSGIERPPEALAIYNFHNPVVERSRTERSMRIIGGNSALLAANLANADIPEGLGDFMMAELESTITLYSTQGNRALVNMERMTNTSDAALISRSLFDPWVRAQLLENQHRRYYSRQDRQRMAECGGLGIFVLAITELKKFADCTTREGNLLFRLAPLLL